MEPFNLERAKAGELFYNSVSDPNSEIPITYLATLPDGKIACYYHSAIGYVATCFREDKMLMKEDPAIEWYRKIEDAININRILRTDFYIPITRKEYEEKWLPKGVSVNFFDVQSSATTAWTTVRIFGRDYIFLIID